MKRILFIIAITAAFAAALHATIRVVAYPLNVVDAKTGTVNVRWDDGLGGVPSTATFYYGTVPGTYTGSLPQSSAGIISFTPASLGMNAGEYYFRVSATGEIMSNEYSFFIGDQSGLGINFIKLSPSPFSPDHGGLKIIYTPKSDMQGMVEITIRALNMAGKLVAEIVRGEMRTSGAVITDTWDGKDKLGYMSKNGRYIIQIEAKDSTGTKQYLNTVILVK